MSIDHTPIENTSADQADSQRRKTLQGMAGILAGMTAPAWISSAWAQDKFPSRPITLVVASAAQGAVTIPNPPPAQIPASHKSAAAQDA